MADHVGQQLGNYRLQRLLGRGGFADVYLGEHTYLHKPAALKLLHLHLDEHSANQFLREAQTLAGLDHPHIVRVLDFAVQDGIPYLVMDYAVGGTLRTRYPAGTRLPLDQILAYITQVASALQYAHDQHLIHRDIKPENMLLNAHEQVLLADFGLALLIPARSASTQAMDPAMAGTAPYLAPERVQGQPRAASDQYALAVVVYEWLCGQRPFKGTPIEVAMQHVSAAPPPLHEHLPDLPPAVEEVVIRALAKAPEQRFPSIQDFATALHHAAHPAANAYVTTLTVPTTSTSHGSHDEREQLAAPRDLLPAEPFWKVPTSLTSFVGRQQDVEAITALLMRPEVHLLTLTGPGGIGKTRLSLHVAAELAEQFADGVCFVNLAPLSDAELVVPTIAQALGVREQGNRPLLEGLQDFLGAKHLLLLLDNFEQVIEAAVHVAALLVAACPPLKILATSRVGLHVQAEREWAVPPLSLPDTKHLPDLETLSQCEAVALFIQRAQAVKADFALTAVNAPAIAAICQQVDGLPLAIELAAARVKVLSVKQIAERLNDACRLLTGGNRTALPRQQTIRATIEWSYNLLPEQERTFFRRLCVFAGGCTLEAAEAICAGDGIETDTVLELLSHLVDQSLVYTVEQDGEMRYRLLEVIQQYGLNKLEAMGEAVSLRRRYRDWYLGLAGQAELELVGRQQGAWLDRFEVEQDNLRSALRWSLEQHEGEAAARIGAGTWSFWLLRGYLSEGRQWLERTLAHLPDRTVVRAKLLRVTAIIAAHQGDSGRAASLVEESLEVWRTVGDKKGIASTLAMLGNGALRRGDYEQATIYYKESLPLLREVGEKQWTAIVLSSLGLMFLYQGNREQARMLSEESLVLFKQGFSQMLRRTYLDCKGGL